SILSATVGSAFAQSAADSSSASRMTFNLPADTAERSLKAFTHQTGQEVLFLTEMARTVTTNPVAGDLTPNEALDRMVVGTKLEAVQDEKTGSWRIRKSDPKNDQRAASRNDRPDRKNDATSTAANADEKPVKLQTFEVMESKLLNMDKPRSKNDAQP